MYLSIDHLLSHYPSLSRSRSRQNYIHLSIFLSHVFIFILQYLCVGLVVLAVVSGSISAVWGCGCSCRTVGEGAWALGGNRSHRATVDPGARLSPLGFTPHWPWGRKKWKEPWRRPSRLDSSVNECSKASILHVILYGIFHQKYKLESWLRKSL